MFVFVIDYQEQKIICVWFCGFRLKAEYDRKEMVAMNLFPECKADHHTHN